MCACVEQTEERERERERKEREREHTGFSFSGQMTRCARYHTRIMLRSIKSIAFARIMFIMAALESCLATPKVTHGLS